MDAEDKDVWKIMAQQAQIPGKYKEDFKDIYVPLMEARYSTGGSMMKWVQERNPQFEDKKTNK